MPRRILFVDDDPSILTDLRHRLRHKWGPWDMAFVESGKDALITLSRGHVDVLIADMRMPDMDGATLLKAVQLQHPKIARILFSEHADRETALRSVPSAHQFLSKSSEASTIESAVERACNLQALLNNEVVERLIGRLDKLPSVPRVYTQLVNALAKETVSPIEVAKLLRQDMAMCVKILQIVNSAFFRLSRTISNIDEAVGYLGLNTIKQIVLAAEVFQTSRIRTRSWITLEALQAHALVVGNLAADLVTEKPLKEDAFVAGLLHDVGKLVLSAELPDDVDKVMSEVTKQDCPIHHAEAQLWGVTHAEVGGYVLGLWGLPHSIVEAVAHHHQPMRVESTEFGVLAATAIANSLIRDESPGWGRGRARHSLTLDTTYLESLRVQDRLVEWKEIARRRLVSQPT